ncbi:ATP-dependent acyl-CoA ligase [Spongiibacter sp. KMU-166]|uniref:ATP-dependent acyl-CoA ligase n=1 Tax=Spongiibacter thalassae TaxID=2721624 RepID=A0ABX1GBK6_9GAMM|nr:AMP-binding protein [Spongiibacter thalassae]NKI16549.1 ATP-dependent acyl-CoA ligase [Spongiibacter thalassae]
MSKGWSSAPLTTVNNVLEDAAAKYPDRVFLDFTGDLYTYSQVNEQAHQLARGLASLGVEKGQTVTSVLDNSFDAILLWFAINKLGAIAVPTNTAYKGEFLRHQICDAGSELVIVEADYLSRVFDLSGQLPSVKTLVCRGEIPSGANSELPVRSFSSLTEGGSSARVDASGVEVRGGDLSMLIYTSGTTGPSKGCMISHNYICNLARQALFCWEPTESDTIWTALPLFHMNALSSIMMMAMIGARVAVYPRFSLSGFWPDIERSGATMASLLGSMAPLIGTAPDSESSKRCYGQLHTVQTAPFPEQLKQVWRDRFGARVLGSVGYGFTEAAMVVYGKLSDEGAPPETSGRLQDDFDVMIVDEYDAELPRGQAGEVVVRPKYAHVCFEGYWNRPADTLKVMRNMWLHTGDIGKLDEQGYFYFLDRKKDYLRRRGENISSFEMEKTFASHPAISDVAVHAVFSEMGEDDVKVTAVLKEGETLGERELCEWCLDKVPYFAVPRYIEFRSDLPRNPTGKILKYQLREEGCTAATWDREKSDFEMQRR